LTCNGDVLEVTRYLFALRFCGGIIMRCIFSKVAKKDNPLIVVT
jgi:hypothetical protein